MAHRARHAPSQKRNRGTPCKGDVHGIESWAIVRIRTVVGVAKGDYRRQSKPAQRTFAVAGRRFYRNLPYRRYRYLRRLSEHGPAKLRNPTILSMLHIANVCHNNRDKSICQP